MTDTPTRTQIRVPAELYGSIVKAAETNARSINAEMVVRLQESFQNRHEMSHKRAIYLHELCESAQQVVRYWEMDNRNEHEEGFLKEAIDDVDRWLNRLQKLDPND